MTLRPSSSWAPWTPRATSTRSCATGWSRPASPPCWWTSGPQGAAAHPADVSREEVAAAGGFDLDALTDRGAAVQAMCEAAPGVVRRLFDEGRCQGVLAAGGSGNTAIATAAMRALPVGVPKLMVSTMASGDTPPYVDVSDVTMMPSVIDVAGLNSVSARILANAAAAMAGMVTGPPGDLGPARPVVAATMFGVTTQASPPPARSWSAAATRCSSSTPPAPAAGHGGAGRGRPRHRRPRPDDDRARRRPGRRRPVGRAAPAGGRGRRGVPQVVSLGALDMVNFGPPETVPAQFARPPPLRAQPERHADAHDAGGVRANSAAGWAPSCRPPPGRSRCSCRCGASRPSPPRAALLDPDGRRGAARRLRRRSAPSVERARGRRAHERPGFAVAMAGALLDECLGGAR